MQPFQLLKGLWAGLDLKPEGWEQFLGVLKETHRRGNPCCLVEEELNSRYKYNMHAFTEAKSRTKYKRPDCATRAVRLDKLGQIQPSALPIKLVRFPDWWEDGSQCP